MAALRTASSAVVLLLLANISLAYTSANQHLDHPDAWYKTDEARRIADNLLSWQTPMGGWPKNEDTGGKPHSGDADKLTTTFDNGATTMELRYLVRMAGVTGEAKYVDAVNRGIDCIAAAQYATGGWPQKVPAGTGYHRHITFNDGAMARLMFFLRDVLTSEQYAFIDPARKAAAKKADDRGIDCILKCQVRVDGKLTVWCAQHDEIDYSPRPARVFEPVSLSGQESLGIMNVLMHVDRPGPEVIAAVDAAAAWFDRSRIKGIRVEDRPNPNSPKGYDRVVVTDPSAPDLWARFYEIGTNRPIFTGRNGEVKYSLAEIDAERRNGYKWYGAWGAAKRLEVEYPQWRKAVTAAK